MIPDHIIGKALDAWIGDHNCPHPDQISVYRVLITRSLEAVAGDIWDEGYSTGDRDRDRWWQNPKEYIFRTGDTPNPYRASETA